MLSRSLRLKLVLASVVVEVLMLSLLVTNSLRLIENSLVEQARLRLEEVTPLLNTSLAVPLAQRDYATLQEILKESRRRNGIEYLVLFDRDNRIVASTGWDRNRPLPEIDQKLSDAERGDHIFDAQTNIYFAGQTYGMLRYGVALDFLIDAKSHLLHQSLFIALGEVLLSVLLLAILGYWLTRHLQMLAAASEAVAKGDFDVNLPVKTQDEVGKLTQTFNTMTSAIRKRIQDLSESKEKQRLFLMQAQQERARLVSLLSEMNLGVCFVGMANRVIYYNPAFLRIWMMRDTVDLNGKPGEEVFSHCANALTRSQDFLQNIRGIMRSHEPSESMEIQLADGRVLTQMSYPVRDQGMFIGRVWIYEDVTSKRQTADQLLYLAERDALTGLYNRHRFQEELTRMAADVDRRRVEGTILVFDLDDFKYVNDTFGHRAGDALLIRVGGEVGRLIRRNEIFARLGGDEFAVLIPDGGEKDAHGLGERILRALSQIPFEFEGKTIRLTASIGIAVYPQHAANVEELIAHADAAMYQAKRAGKNTSRVYRYDRDTSREMVNRLSWNERITRALERDLFKLHFQGIYNSQDVSLNHVEVLVRMIDEEQPDRLILPGQFIPFAEKTGKIVEIDRWVLRQAIALLAESPKMPPIAVNISGRSFDDPDLPQYIADQLQQSGVEPQRLYVELTETQAVSDLRDAQRFIDALHETGCKVCLDDFGSGFSSFAYLKHLKADILKIDGQFIRDLPNDRGNQLFVEAMAGLARGFGKTTVAEFVENADILKMLKKIGIDMVQGYHLDIPGEQHVILAKTEGRKLSA